MYDKQPEKQIFIAKCPHCGGKETQQHCMIDCTESDYISICWHTRVIQDVAALKLLQKYNKAPLSTIALRQFYMPAGLSTHNHADYGWQYGQKNPSETTHLH
jgi:hypothetical protein